MSNKTICKGCGEETTGSIGATGLQWSFICQQCKDAADNETKNTYNAMDRAFKTLLDRLEEQR